MKPKIYFHPWVGPDYQTSVPRILVMGDSPYCGACPFCGVRGENGGESDTFGDDCEFNIHNVRRYVDFYRGVEGNEPEKRWQSNTYPRFTKAFYGREDILSQEHVSLWNRIAFYNFIQSAASVDHKNNNYSSDDKIKSKPIAQRVIDELQPDLVIVWGSQAYNAFSLVEMTAYEENKDIEDSWQCRLKSGHIMRVVRIHHPAALMNEQDYIATNHHRILQLIKLCCSNG